MDPDASTETPEEMWLESVLLANGGIALMHELALNGCLSGDVYVRLLPVDDEYPYPQVVPIDPTTITTFWKSDDIRKVLWHEVHWAIEDFDSVGHTTIAEYLLDFINLGGRTWQINQYVNVTGSATGWTLQEDQSYTWTTPVPPIIHWKHLPNPGNYYGRSEATHLDLNDKLNLIASENNRIIRYHSSPSASRTVVPSEMSLP